MRRVPIPALLGALAAVGAQAAGHGVEVSFEGRGPLREEDGPVLARLVEGVLSSRFPGGFGSAEATLELAPPPGLARLVLELERPTDEPGLARMGLRIQVGGWRKVLDQGRLDGAVLDLEEFRLGIDPAMIASLLGGGRDRVRLKRVGPGQSFAPERPTAADREAFAAGGAVEGFRPMPGGSLRNGRSDAVWLAEGRLGPPISHPAVAVVRPETSPGGRLGLRVELLVAGGRSRGARDMLALEARLQAALDDWWEAAEDRVGGRAYVTRTRLGPAGDLEVEGVGFLVFDPDRRTRTPSPPPVPRTRPGRRAGD